MTANVDVRMLTMAAHVDFRMLFMAESVEFCMLFMAACMDFARCASTARVGFCMALMPAKVELRKLLGLHVWTYANFRSTDHPRFHKAYDFTFASNSGNQAFFS